jgi:hypothetical protein
MHPKLVHCAVPVQECSGESRGLYEDISQLLNLVFPSIRQTRKPLASLNGKHITKKLTSGSKVGAQDLLTLSVSEHKLLNSAAEYSAVTGCLH